MAEKLEAAKTVEEKAKILSDAGFELSEEEIEKVAGGIVVNDWHNDTDVGTWNYVDIEITL